MTELVSTNAIRDRFTDAMSAMYRDEVPAYGDLVALVNDVNAAARRFDHSPQGLMADADEARFEKERHGAIRVGKPEELAMLARVFSVMGMRPVGYYNLMEAGLPVHSTAFRPITAEALSANPFRIFCSLLRLDLIEDEDLRRAAEAALGPRKIFTDKAIELVERAEAQGGLTQAEADAFVDEVVLTFKWRSEALVPKALYDQLLAINGLIADIVSFKGPHINHLTPRTLDIDAVQQEMPARGLNPKAIIEGPPRRSCPILLRQTSFRALKEVVKFQDASRDWVEGAHTARFGEIEQRGAALTPKGRALYDELLSRVLETVAPRGDGANADDYYAALKEVFAEFPDDWEVLRREGLIYVAYRLTEAGRAAGATGEADPEIWIEKGWVETRPQTYEDFLPVSAAGIFRSNLGSDKGLERGADADQRAFEAALGAPVMDPFSLYQDVQDASLDTCRKTLNP